MDKLTTGSQNTAVGLNALQAVTTVSNCTAVGYQALYANTSGQENTGFGSGAMDANTTGNYNDAFGKDALGSGSGFGSCCAFGNSALKVNTADGNCAFGFVALGANTSGSSNSAFGSQALDANTTAIDNAAFGFKALTSCTTGGSNTAVGRDALHDVTTCSATTAIGTNAGGDITTGTQNTFVGFYASVGHLSGGSDNVLYIARNDSGAGNQATWIRGDAAGACFQGNNSSTWSTTSDARIKKNIIDNNQGLEIINNIKIRNFEYRTPEEIDLNEFPKIVESGLDATCISKWGTKGTQIGVIAQELEETLPDCIITDENKGNKEVNSDPILWYLVNAVKELSAKVTALEAG